MLNDYGGPVWHASVAWQTPNGMRPISMLFDSERVAMWALAAHELAGVGDPALGEWREPLERSLHLKRRLTPAEWGERPWGIDLRRTWEGRKRLDAVCAHLPPTMRAFVRSEVEG